MTAPLVLLVTHTGDYYTVDRVAAALSRRGAEPIRLDTDLFPRELRLSMCSDADAHAHLDGAFGRVSAADVRAVWMRKLWSPVLDPDLEPAYRAACERESAAALRGFLSGLGHARWVDELARQVAAEDKLLQLRSARAVGLSVPRTLVSNDPAEVRGFYRSLEGHMVAKLLTPVSVSMDASGAFVYTNEVHEQDLGELESLRYSPMVFQERVEKRLELRVIHVAGRLFVGAIDASQSSRGRVDWRRADPGECRWQPGGELPAEVATRVRALMQRLGLRYGALDLIVTPSGEHVFLEVNPAGEWGMLERDLELPISEALADALMEEPCSPS